jgi:hypothetical protein
MRQRVGMAAGWDRLRWEATRFPAIRAVLTWAMRPWQAARHRRIA